MIKAEIISHEGTPAPNWLDQCRSAATPGRISILIVFIAASAIIFGVLQKDATPTTETKASQQSQSSSLQVQPLNQAPVTTENGMANVQPTAESTLEATPTKQTNTPPAGLGAESTPALNNATRPSDVTAPRPSGQGQLNGRGLTQTVQTTIQTLNQTVERTRDALRDTLQNPLGR